MEISWRTCLLHLADPFTISRETKTEKRNVLVAITEDGFTGIGEAAPSPYYRQSVDSVFQALEEVRLEAIDGGMRAAHLELELERMAVGDSSAGAALDIALNDLAAKKAGLPLYSHLGLKRDVKAVTSFTIGIDAPEVMVEKVKRAVDYPVLKVKLGFEGDMDALEAVRGTTDKTIRVDANGGWSLQEAMAKFPLLVSLGVEYVEQPLPKGELEGLRVLRDRFPIPVFADEDALTPEDVPGLSGVVDGINLKLMKCGGVGPALRMIDQARQAGLQVMIGCMIESSVGITAAAHLASLADYLDLDGNLLISDDPYRGVLCRQGRLILPTAPGLGVVQS